MTEVTFAKQFLSSVDARPINLSSDHVADPRQLPAQPAFILPRNPKAFTKPSPDTSANNAAAPTATSQSTSQSLSITLKTIRPTPSTPTSLVITSQTPQNSIYDLKSAAAKRAGYAADKVKILWEKRPASDSKTIAEVIGGADASGNVEMAIMFVGSPTAVPEPEQAPAAVGSLPNAEGAAMEAVETRDARKAGGAGGGGGNTDTVMQNSGEAAAVAQGTSGWDVCETDEFWDDLGSFVLQRVRDEAVATALVAKFRESWKGAR